MTKHEALVACLVAATLAGCGGGGGGSEAESSRLTTTTTTVNTQDTTVQASGLVLSSVTVGASTTAQVSCPQTQTVSVTAFGARPDDGVDDTAALQRALNESAPGTTLVLPAGRYQLSSVLLPRSDLTLCASTTATLAWTGGSGHLIDAVYRGRADRFNLYNLTFDGASVILAGTGNRVVNNTFRNINRPAGAPTTDRSRLYGLHLVDFTDGVVEHNVFSNIDTETAIIGYGVSGSRIRQNTMSQVFQAMHFFDLSSTEVSQNRISGVRRMGIEVQGLNLTGAVIRDNVLSDWRYQADQRELIGLSVVSGKGVVIQGNVLRCGAGCEGSERGWGMELGGGDAMQVRRNVVQGFSVGIGVAILDSVHVEGNAVYDAHAGIFKFNNGPVHSSLRITGNQIENARDCGICGEWTLAHAPVVAGNTVVREAGRWEGDAGRRYVGITVSPVALGAPPMQVASNRLLLEGSPTAGLQAWGLCLCGKLGNLAGLTLDSNWFGSAASWGGGILINAEGAAHGVRFQSNVFQGVASAVAGVHTWLAGSFTAAGNLAINVPSSGLWPGLVPTSSVAALPGFGLSAAGTGHQRTLQTALEGGSSTEWLFGDGFAAITSGTAIRHLYAIDGGHRMMARAWVPHPSGGWLTGRVGLGFAEL